MKTLVQIYGTVNILGIVAPQDVNIEKFSKIEKPDLAHMNYDLVLVSGVNTNFVAILNEIQLLGLDSDKFVLDRTVLIPNFTLEKYKKLRHSQLSILSLNCWGGLVYNRFGLPFLSPTINMFTSEKDFLRFLNDPIRNANKGLVFQRTAYEDNLKFNYPIFKIGKSEWHMNHYPDFKVAKQKWIERTKRINCFNVLVSMYTETPEVLKEFDKLPFAKKVCFVNFETDLESGFYLDTERYNEPLWRLTNLTAHARFANGYNFYDMWDMLLYGKKTPLA